MFFEREENPWLEDAEIQADWDARVNRLPHCHRCGRAIPDSRVLYLAEHDEYYCSDCVEAQMEWNEEAELE